MIRWSNLGSNSEKGEKKKNPRKAGVWFCVCFGPELSLCFLDLFPLLPGIFVPF